MNDALNARLGRSVKIVEGLRLQYAARGIPQRRGQRLAAAVEPLHERGRRLVQPLPEGAQQRWHVLQVGNALRHRDSTQITGVLMTVRSGEDEPSTRHER